MSEYLHDITDQTRYTTGAKKGFRLVCTREGSGFVCLDSSKGLSEVCGFRAEMPFQVEAQRAGKGERGAWGCGLAWKGSR